ncbi:hypothetical protein HDU99_000938 [Rhizoclosmatium hyalinum]|nr:hypothetical protein HDU99_000938 [Rhizoclosmatium hyalinum]
MPPKRTDAVVSYKDDDDDEKAAIRSAQNRKAQRLYRQRKEARVRELEATVARLAATEECDAVTPREAELMRRIEILETENRALKATASQPYHPTYPMYPMHGYHPYSYYHSYYEQGYNHPIPPSHAPFCQSPSNPHFAPHLGDESHLTDMTTCESIESNDSTLESTAIERVLQELPSLKNCSSTVNRFCRLFEDICRMVNSPKSLEDDFMSKILVQTQLGEASKAFNRRKAGSASTFLAVGNRYRVKVGEKCLGDHTMTPRARDSSSEDKEDKKDTDRAAIRAAQNRKAQRLYRQRKEARVRELEATVAKIVGGSEAAPTPREEALLERIRQLEEENSILRTNQHHYTAPTYHPYAYPYHPAYHWQYYPHPPAPVNHFAALPNQLRLPTHEPDFIKPVENLYLAHSTSMEHDLLLIPSLKPHSEPVIRLCQTFVNAIQAIESLHGADHVLSAVEIRDRRIVLASLQIQALLMCSPCDRIEMERITDCTQIESGDVAQLVNTLGQLDVE